MAKARKKLPMDTALETQRTTLKNLIRTVGGQQQLADSLGITQAGVSKWVVQGFVPLGRAVEIEATFGVPRTSIANPRIVQALTSTEFTAAAA